MSSKPITLDRIIAWLNKTEGRDKFCKAIQYGARILKHNAVVNGDKELALRFDGLFVGMRNARKLFRLFKTINEYQKLVEILTKKGNSFDKALNALNRIFFGLYWYVLLDIGSLTTLESLELSSSSKQIRPHITKRDPHFGS